VGLEALATALGWPLPRVQAALAHAQAHPQLAGPFTVRRVPPQTYTLTPRLDVLTDAQHQALTASRAHRDILGEDQAAVLYG
jgi:hypothetical protein